MGILVTADPYILTTVFPVQYKVLHDGEFIGWMVPSRENKWIGYVFAIKHLPAIRLEQPIKDPSELARNMVDFFREKRELPSLRTRVHNG